MQPLFLPNVSVKMSADAGGYYCEHVLFCLSHFAKRHMNQWATGGDRLPRVGFIHVPEDESCWMTPDSVEHEGRYDGAIELWTRIIRGFQKRKTRGLRLLVTGFGAFKDVNHNPTEGLITHGFSLFARMLEDELHERPHLTWAKAATPSTNRASTGIHGDEEQRFLRSPTDGELLFMRCENVDWTIAMGVLPVDDHAIALEKDTGLGLFARTFQPNAAIAMGVARGESAYRIECVSTNRHLKMGEHGFTRDESQPGNMRYENDWLWGLIQDGCL